jgi:hypothetical protein
MSPCGAFSQLLWGVFIAERIGYDENTGPYFSVWDADCMECKTDTTRLAIELTKFFGWLIMILVASSVIGCGGSYDVSLIGIGASGISSLVGKFYFTGNFNVIVIC